MARTILPSLSYGGNGRGSGPGRKGVSLSLGFAEAEDEPEREVDAEDPARVFVEAKVEFHDNGYDVME